MNCNNKTAKNKDSSISDFSNGQFRFSSRYSSNGTPQLNVHKLIWDSIKDYVSVKETHSLSELRWEVSLYHLEAGLESWVAILYCMQIVNFEDLR